uniref:Uncharacterized protein n=1 Tax=Heterosigma akashiwo TaxID=2829 RepID=A0A6S9KWS4_HETAK
MALSIGLSALKTRLIPNQHILAGCFLPCKVQANLHLFGASAAGMLRSISSFSRPTPVLMDKKGKPLPTSAAGSQRMDMFNPDLEEVVVAHDTGLELEGRSVEELLALARASYPERAGPRGNRHKQREKIRFRQIRRQHTQQKYQRIAAAGRKQEKKRKMHDLFKMYAKDAPALKV